MSMALFVLVLWRTSNVSALSSLQDPYIIGGVWKHAFTNGAIAFVSLQ
jgi:hypothetical protein